MTDKKRFERLEKVLIEFLELSPSVARARLALRLKDEPPVDHEHLQFETWFSMEFQSQPIPGIIHGAARDGWQAGCADCAKQLSEIRRLLDCIGPNNLTGRYAAISKWCAGYDKGRDDG